MGEHQAVAEVVPETPTEEALAVAAERIVALVGSPAAGMNTRHTIAGVLRAYEFMRRESRYVVPEAQAVVAVAAEVKGLVTWVVGGEVVAMAAMWPTSNPNVNRQRKLPELVRDGQYLYIDWYRGTGDYRDLREAIKYGAERFPEAAFVCAHEGRGKRRGSRVRGCGRLVVRKLRREAGTIRRLLEMPRNG